MTTVTSKWFEAKVKYAKMQEDGTEKMTCEQYVVNALSFTEAEAAVIENVAPFITGDFEIAALAIASYKEVTWADSKESDKWYKAKIAFITLDEKTAKEKSTTQQVLIQGSSLNDAIANVDKLMQGSMTNYVSVTMSETKIMDVFHKD